MLRLGDSNLVIWPHPNGTTLENWHMEPKNHLFEKENHLNQTSIVGLQNMNFPVVFQPSNTVDGSEIRRSPVEVGSLSHYLHGFIHPRWFAGFLPSTVPLNVGKSLGICLARFMVLAAAPLSTVRPLADGKLDLNLHEVLKFACLVVGKKLKKHSPHAGWWLVIYEG